MENRDGAVSYDLPDEGFEIPKEYFAGVQASDEEVRNTIEFLSNQYTKLLGFEEIAPVSWGEYTFSGEFFRRRFSAYDSSGDDVTDLLNYYFNQTFLKSNPYFRRFGLTDFSKL